MSLIRTLPVGLSLGLLAIGALATSARASDLTIKARLIETFEISDNYFMRPNPAGETYRIYSTLGLDVIKRTPTTRYTFNGDFSYYNYLGPGANDTAMTHGKNHNARFTVDSTSKPSENSYRGSIAWAHQDLATVLLGDLGTGSVARGDVDTYSLDGNIVRKLSAIDILSWSGNIRSVDLSAPGSTDYTTFSNTGVWTRRLTRSTDFITTGAVDYTLRANNTETVFYRATGGMKSQVTPRLSVAGSAGIGIVYSTGVSAVPVDSSLTGVPVIGTGTSVGWLGDLLATYKLTQTTRVRASLSQGIVPDTFGNLSERQTATAGLDHDINRRSSILLASSFTHYTSSGSANTSNASDYFTASATYRHQIAREWQTQFSYYYRHRTSSGGNAQSNGVYAVLTKDFTLKP
jgi:hypothetical protein